MASTAFLAAPAADNVLVSSLATRSKSIAGMTQEDRDAAVAAAQRTVQDMIRPAFDRVRALLTAELPVAGEDAGLWRLPRGAEAYAAALHVNTTTTLSAEKIHAVGLREVARISTDMDARLRALGYAEGSVEKRYKALEASLQPAADPRPSTAAARGA